MGFVRAEENVGYARLAVGKLRFSGSRIVASLLRELRQRFQIAADAETTVAKKIPGIVVDRQPGQFDRKAQTGIVRRPIDLEIAPGAACRDCFCNIAFRIEIELRDDVAPCSAKSRSGVWPDQAGEFPGIQKKAAARIHLPHETQRMTPRRRRLVVRFRNGRGGDEAVDRVHLLFVSGFVLRGCDGLFERLVPMLRRGLDPPLRRRGDIRSVHDSGRVMRRLRNRGVGRLDSCQAFESWLGRFGIAGFARRPDCRIARIDRGGSVDCR